MKQLNIKSERNALKKREGQIMELENENKMEKAWKALFAARGVLKGKGKAKTEEEWCKFREEASKELIEYYEKKFGFNLK